MNIFVWYLIALTIVLILNYAAHNNDGGGA